MQPENRAAAKWRLRWRKLRWMFSNRVVASTLTVSDPGLLRDRDWIYIEGHLFRVRRIGAAIYVY